MKLIRVWLLSLENDLKLNHLSCGTGLAFSVSMRMTRTGNYSDVNVKDKSLDTYLQPMGEKPDISLYCHVQICTVTAFKLDWAACESTLKSSWRVMGVSWVNSGNPQSSARRPPASQVPWKFVPWWRVSSWPWDLSKCCGPVETCENAVWGFSLMLLFEFWMIFNDWWYR